MTLIVGFTTAKFIEASSLFCSNNKYNASLIESSLSIARRVFSFSGTLLYSLSNSASFNFKLFNFKSVDLAHNSESVEGLIPAEASPWKGEINENISVTLNEEGVYVYQCTPHLILGMIGVIQVGEAVNLNEVKANVGKLTFAVNPERLSNYLNLVE